MQVKVADTAVTTLQDILKDKKDQPSNVRIYFAGIGWGGPSFGLALDEQKDSDLTYEVEGITFVMDKSEHAQHGDISIIDTGYGFKVTPENMNDSEGGCGGCGGGCGH